MTKHTPADSFNYAIYPAETERVVSRPAVRDDIFTHVRPLRAYAILLVGDQTQADDLAEEALRTAWRDFPSFPQGGKLRAWLFSILRSAYFLKPQKAVRRAVASQAALLEGLNSQLDADAQKLAAFQRAFACLPDVERETLHLVAAEGLSLSTAAIICGCAVGTIKSRAHRGSQRLEHLFAR